MKKIDVLILNKVIGPFVLSFAVVLFILLSQFLIQQFGFLLGKDLAFAEYVEVFSLFAVRLVPTASALAVLLSTIIAYGALGEHGELIAIKASGVSLLRILRPAFIFVLLLSIGFYFFNDTVVPWANEQLTRKFVEIRAKRPGLDLEDGVFFSGMKGYSIKAESKDEDGKVLNEVMIYDHSEKGSGNTKVTIAKRGIIKELQGGKYMELELFDGASYYDMSEDSMSSKKEDMSFARNYFNHSKFYINTAKDEEGKIEVYRERGMMNIKGLVKNRDSLALALDKQANLLKDSIQIVTAQTAGSSLKPEKELVERRSSIISRIRRDVTMFNVDIARRYSDVLALLVMFLIGAPLGAVVRKGGIGVPVLLAIVFFGIYSMLLNSGMRAARQEKIPVEIGCWLGHIVLLIIGCYLLYQAYRDSRVFESDYYQVLKNKLFKKSN